MLVVSDVVETCSVPDQWSRLPELHGPTVPSACNCSKFEPNETGPSSNQADPEPLGSQSETARGVPFTKKCIRIVEQVWVLEVNCTPNSDAVVTGRLKRLEQSWPAPGQKTAATFVAALLVLVMTVIAFARLNCVCRSRMTPAWLVAHRPLASRQRKDR